MISATEIRKTRETYGETQGEFAQRFHVDQSTVSRWEKFGISDRLTAIAVKSLLQEKLEHVT